jgi:PAS domain S-box-containing protein
MPFKDTGTLVLTLEGRIAFASTYFSDPMGIEHNEAAGRSWFEFVFPDDMGAARGLFEAAKLPHADPIRFRLRRQDGAEVWTDTSRALGSAGRQNLRHNSHDHQRKRQRQSLNERCQRGYAYG